VATQTLNSSATNATTHVAKHVATAVDTHKTTKGNEMAKPSITKVKSWDVVYDSDLVSVAVGTAEFPQDYWMLKNKATGKKKYFYGEMAWADSRREASDIDFGAWSIN
jgi:hypothetical protein